MTTGVSCYGCKWCPEESTQSLTNRMHYEGRWKKEYLTGLREFQKNNSTLPTKQIKVGYIVLIEEEGLRRYRWWIAKVLELFTSKDGYVRGCKLRVYNEKRRLSFINLPVNNLCFFEVSSNSDKTRSWYVIQCWFSWKSRGECQDVTIPSREFQNFGFIFIFSDFYFSDFVFFELWIQWWYGDQRWDNDDIIRLLRNGISDLLDRAKLLPTFIGKLFLLTFILNLVEIRPDY